MPINRDTIIDEKVVSGNSGRTFNHFEGFATENPDGTRTLRIRFDEVDSIVFSDGTSYTKQRDQVTDVELLPLEAEFSVYNLRTGTPTATKRSYGLLSVMLQSVYLNAVAKVAP